MKGYTASAILQPQKCDKERPNSLRQSLRFEGPVLGPFRRRVNFGHEFRNIMRWCICTSSSAPAVVGGKKNSQSQNSAGMHLSVTHCLLSFIIYLKSNSRTTSRTCTVQSISSNSTWVYPIYLPINLHDSSWFCMSQWRLVGKPLTWPSHWASSSLFSSSWRTWITSSKNDSLTTQRFLKASLLTASSDILGYLRIPASCAWCSSSLIDKVEVRFWPAERLAQPSTMYHEVSWPYHTKTEIIQSYAIHLSVYSDLYSIAPFWSFLIFSQFFSPTLLTIWHPKFRWRASFCRWVVEMSFSSCWPSYCNL